jgi:hypothetical protein
MTNHGRQNSTEEIEISLSVGVVDMPALATNDLNRLVIVQRNPRWQDRTMALQKITWHSVSPLLKSDSPILTTFVLPKLDLMYQTLIVFAKLVFDE